MSSRSSFATAILLLTGHLAPLGIGTAQQCGDNISTLRPLGAYDRVDLFDDLAIVRDLELRSIALVDLTDPAVPIERGAFPTGETLVDDVALYADTAFAVRGTDLLVLDVSDPAQPSLVTTSSTPGALTHVDTWGRLAVVYDLEFRQVRIFDVSDPALPGQVSTWEAEPIEDLTLSEGTLVLSFAASIDTVDLTAPNQPMLIETFVNNPLIVGGPVGAAPDQLVAVDREFAGLDTEIQILDMTDPSQPFPFLGNLAFSGPDDVSVSGCRAAIVGEELELFDLTSCGACRIRCAPDDTTLCLGTNQRFRLTLDWQTTDDSGQGRAVDIDRRDSGAFWFFEKDNVELLVKVLDACSVPGAEAFWVLFSASTDQGYNLRVEDLVAGQIQSYDNPIGQLSPARIDIDAFPTCDD